jgi:hypothetical protein
MGEIIGRGRFTFVENRDLEPQDDLGGEITIIGNTVSEVQRNKLARGIYNIDEIVEEERTNTRKRLIDGLSNVLASIDQLLTGDVTPEEVQEELLKLRKEERKYLDLMDGPDIAQAQDESGIAKTDQPPPELPGNSIA